MDPEKVEWDALVVGTGIGGATLGYALAEAGRRVLFVEKGLDLRLGAGERIAGRFVEDTRGFRSRSSAERERDLARGGRSVAAVERADGSGRPSFVPMLGSGTGGSASLYGMILDRMFPIDFVPRTAFHDIGDSSLPDAWPISYEDLRPWYECAERLYRIRGSPDPLRPDQEQPALLPPPPLSSQNAYLFEALSARGLHPYRAHTASEQVPGCQTCSGYLCPSDCKNDATRICLTPAIEKFGAHLLTECAATFLEANRTEVRRVICSWRGRRIELRAKTVILAAGALATPLLLLNSTSEYWPNGLANDSDLVGRNLMLHDYDIYVLTRAPKMPDKTWIRELAFNDFYVSGSHKLGTVQSGGPAPPLSYHRNRTGLNLWRLLGPLAPLVWGPLSRQPLLGAVLDQLPFPENRVRPARSPGAQSGNRLHLHYRQEENDLRRRRVFRKAIASSLRPLRPLRVFRIGDRQPDLTHACGTCRFGMDPHSSVLDRWNQAHGLDNLYVVDASFFPSSSGANPSLTIAANALRVAQRLITTT